MLFVANSEARAQSERIQAFKVVVKLEKNR